MFAANIKIYFKQKIMLSDIEIAQSTTPKHIKLIAEKLNIDADDLEY